MKHILAFSLFLFCFSSVLFAFGPSGWNPSGFGGGGQQPGGGGNQPEPPGGGGGGATFTFDTFLTDSTTVNGCIVYGNLMTGYIDGQTVITIPSSVTKIVDGAFAGNTSVTTVDASTTTGIVIIPESFAAGCTNLVKVVLPLNVTTVGASAFMMDSSLTTFTGDGVTTVEDYAFFGCTSLSLPSSMTYEAIGEAALNGVSYKSDDGEVYASETAPLVAWIKAGGSVVSSLSSAPSSCDTSTLKTWLTNNVANLEAYLYANEFSTNTNFTALSVSGTNFLFTAQDLTTLSVAHAALQVSTDLVNWKTVSESDIVDGVYTMPSATNGFARIIYSLMW